jgi:pentatricopeptide repeat protein
VADDALALYDEMRGKTTNLGNKPRPKSSFASSSSSSSSSSNNSRPLFPPPPPVAPDIVTFTVLISILEKHGRHAEALRVFSDGVRAKVLMTTRLDSLWERDLSRLSYQLVRAAVDYTLRELAKDYKVQKKAAAGSKEPNVNDLVLITGVDLRGGGKRGAVGGAAGSSSREDPETRQGLACLVLREKGLVPAGQEVGEAGVLKVPAAGLREWLAKQ